MPDLVRLALAPILLAQGKRLFQTMPRLPEPAGAREGTVGAGPPLRLLIVGDSSGAGVGVETLDQALLGQTVSRLATDFSVTFRLVARHGSTLPRTLKHLAKQSDAAFDIALLAIGTNDVMAGRALDAWLRDYDELAAVLRERFGARHLVASGLPPVGQFPAIPNPLRWVVGRQARRHDAALAAWAARQPDVTFIDFETAPGDPLHGVPMAEIMADDGFHPGPRIYDEWGRRAADAVRAVA